MPAGGRRDELRLVSADSHVVEPLDLWVERVDRRFRDDAPRVELDADRRPIFTGAGIRAWPVGSAAAGARHARVIGREPEAGDVPAGCWDPAARLEAQDCDGIAAEVLYPTVGMFIYRGGSSNGPLLAECIRVYNDWLADFCRTHPDRFVGVAMVPLFDVPAACAELERSASLGLRGAMVWSGAPDHRRYCDRAYEPFWRAATECQMPLSMHGLTGRGVESRSERHVMARQAALSIHEVQRSIVDLTLGGVFERHPSLQVVSAQNDIGWVPDLVRRLDRVAARGNHGGPMKLKDRPSELLRRQLFATFQVDPVGVATAGLFGEDNFLWANNYPRVDSTWPASRAVIECAFATASPMARSKMLSATAAALYRIRTERLGDL